MLSMLVGGNLAGTEEAASGLKPPASSPLPSTDGSEGPCLTSVSTEFFVQAFSMAVDMKRRVESMGEPDIPPPEVSERNKKHSEKTTHFWNSCLTPSPLVKGGDFFPRMSTRASLAASDTL